MPRADLAKLHPTPTLSCLVCGGKQALTDALVQRLQRSRRVGGVEHVADALALQHALTVRDHDLLIYVLAAPDEALPRCLLTCAELRVLVVAPDGVSGTLSRWLQQGATDLVSPDDEDGLAHALSRLLDECALLAELRRRDTVIATQQRRIDALLRRDDARLSGARAVPAAAPVRRPAAVSSQDGLPGRRQSLRRLLALQRRAQGAQAQQPVVALQLVLPFGGMGEVPGKLDRAFCDLMLYRAVDAVRSVLPRRLLLGRTRQHALIVLFPLGPGMTSGAVTRTLRSALGTLGDLLDSSDEIVIDSLTGSLGELASADLVERLERTDSAPEPSHLDVVQVLPVLNTRAELPSAAMTALGS